MANLPNMASLLITNNLPNNENIVYQKDGAGEIRIPSQVASPYDDTINLNCSAYLNYEGTPQPNKTWLICFKNKQYCLEMVDVSNGSAPYHTLFRFSPITPITNNDCEITAKMGSITSVAQKVDDVKIEIFNKLPELCNVFTTINNNFTQTNIIPPKISDLLLNSLSFHFYINYKIEVYFTLNTVNKFAVKITIKDAPFIVRKYGMNRTNFELNYVEIQPQDINLTIEPD